MLVVTAAASFFLGERSDAVIIGVILVLSVGLGFFDEYRAEKATEALHSRLRHRCVVILGGVPASVDVTDVVPGDVVRLSVGELVPADLRLMGVAELECDEAVLTGEPFAVAKQTASVPAGAAPATIAASRVLLSPYAGLVVDRLDKHRLIMRTQLVLGLLAATLWLLTVTHVVALWMVMVLAAALGVTTSLDTPARQAFVSEMVGASLVGNAVTLNSVLMNAARAVGPAVAGLLIVTTGVGVCFLLNALSFAAVLVALALMDRERLHPAEPVRRAPGQLVAGLRYVRHVPALRVPLLMMALIGALSYEFMVVLPVLARTTFGGDADAYGLLTAVLGAGAVVGGLAVAARPAAGLRRVVVAAAGFGVAMLLAAAAPTLSLEAAALVLVGAASVTFMSRGNATLQLSSRPQMRGRVMALWTVAFLGTTPVGGPGIGWICAQFGQRWALVTGGAAALGAALLAVGARRRVAPLPPYQLVCMVAAWRRGTD